jgi:hypothetical protein
MTDVVRVPYALATPYGQCERLRPLRVDRDHGGPSEGALVVVGSAVVVVGSAVVEGGESAMTTDTAVVVVVDVFVGVVDGGADDVLDAGCGAVAPGENGSWAAGSPAGTTGPVEPDVVGGWGTAPAGVCGIVAP